MSAIDSTVNKLTEMGFGRETGVKLHNAAHLQDMSDANLFEAFAFLFTVSAVSNAH